MIADIYPGDPPMPLNIRALKTWIPHFNNNERKKDICYLFVDAHGDAIEATADASKADHFHSIIKLQSCYTIDQYVAVQARTFMPVVDHRASLRMGERATFTPISGEDIPYDYYNFATYDQLRPRLQTARLLTDYLGRIEDVGTPKFTANSRLRKVMIQDVDRHLIEVTLWRQRVDEIQQENTVGKLLAITSALVTDFKGNLQLETTNATTIEVDPLLPNIQEYIKRFKEIGEPSKQLTTEERVTIAELIAINNNNTNRFVCKAAITDIQTNRPWFSVTCAQCTNKAHRQAKEFVCEDHGVQPDHKFMYCVNATIQDDTGNTSAVLFNEAMNDVLGITCRDMVLTQENMDSKILPQEIRNIKGIQRTLHINKKPDGSIVINKVENPNTLPPPTPDPKASTNRRDIMDQPKSKKAKN